jgi:hypothetical protein
MRELPLACGAAANALAECTPWRNSPGAALRCSNQAGCWMPRCAALLAMRGVLAARGASVNGRIRWTELQPRQGSMNEAMVRM